MSKTRLDDHGAVCREIRRLATDASPDGSAVHVGRASYEKEMAYRKMRNEGYDDVPPVANPFPIPTWESLPVVFKDGKEYPEPMVGEFRVGGAIAEYEKERARQIANYIQHLRERGFSQENMDTLAWLMPLNVPYHCEFGITEKDAEKARALQAILEAPIMELTPHAGDIVEVMDHRSMERYARARVDSVHCSNPLNEYAAVCLEPLTPFIEVSSRDFEFEMSGGPFAGIKLSKMVHVGTDTALFWTWGSAGRRANGALNFPARVNVWRAEIFADTNTEGGAE